MQTTVVIQIDDNIITSDNYFNEKGGLVELSF